MQALGTWVAHVVVALRRHTGTPVQAAVADLAPTLEDVPAALAGIDLGDPDERLVALLLLRLSETRI